MGAPAFARTPDQFPDLKAAAIDQRDLAQWAAERGIVMIGGDPSGLAQFQDPTTSDR
jgi:hypothetical protein